MGLLVEKKHIPEGGRDSPKGFKRRKKAAHSLKGNVGKMSEPPGMQVVPPNPRAGTKSKRRTAKLRGGDAGEIRGHRGKDGGITGPS